MPTTRRQSDLLEQWGRPTSSNGDVSQEPSRNASIQVRATSHKKWIHVGCTDPGNRALTNDKLEQLLRRASEALDFVQAHSNIDLLDDLCEGSHWITETVRGVCNWHLNGRCSVENLYGKPWGADPHMELDTNDLNSYYTIYHYDPSPSTQAKSQCEETSSSINAEKKRTETRFPKTDYSEVVTASEQSQQLKKKVKDTIKCLSTRGSRMPLDCSQAHMEKIELVASVWRVIRKFHPKLVSEEEWDNLKTLGENVDAW